jgi:hypothetical protein
MAPASAAPQRFETVDAISSDAVMTLAFIS